MPIIGTLANGSARGYVALSVSAVPNSFSSIASQVADGTSGTITFNNIPQTYTHLQLRVYAAAATDTQLDGTINNVTSNVYFNHVNGWTQNARFDENNGARGTMIYEALTSATNFFTSYVIDILDYTGSKPKTTRGYQGFVTNSSSMRGSNSSNMTSQTTAITRLDLIARGTTFRSGSVFALYGIGE
jgi:hypothetical protein